MKKKIFLNILQFYNMIIFILFCWSSYFNSIKKIIALYTVIMIALLMIVAIKERINILKHVKIKFLCLGIFLIMLGISPFSIDIKRTIFKCIYILFITLYVIVISSIYDEDEFFSLLSKYFIVTIIVSFICIIFIPNIGTMYYDGHKVVRGVFQHKNILARNMMLASVIFINYGFKSKNLLKKIFYLINIILCLILIVLSKSTTGIILFFVFNLANIILDKINKLSTIYVKLTYIVTIVSNIFVLIISSPKLASILSNIQIGSKDLTFTGRNVIWNFALSSIAQRPILGFGLNAFWKNSQVKNSFESLYRFDITHAHNGYLNMIIDGGLILILIVLVLVIRSINYNLLTSDSKYSRTVIVLLSMTLIINIIESSFIDDSAYIFWIIICFSYCKYKEKLYILKK